MHTTLLPEGWPRPSGYANGILARGDALIFTGGQIGWTPDGRFESGNFVDQFRQALLNIRAVLESAGAGPEHMTRMTWFITDKPGYLRQLREVGATYREIMGRNFPAMSVLVVSELVENEAVVEIEVTAVI
ncbi:MAG: RidA family protein [Chromatocurvus sp.]